ncbi:hypothetical protein [Paenibacillus sp. UNC499MF]|uniref:hypothetical protein n=1 Tax=Paenibacillus sp. UNC499MF TaxID=1502751 RepID=UPI0008A09790|nr:hypothetical protein [Paenibacillus sp. UNC499MF]SEG70004.1 hypothetical protein SAMN02799616_04361 [Paenibacillus sp. UNC499MF]
MKFQVKKLALGVALSVGLIGSLQSAVFAGNTSDSSFAIGFDVAVANDQSWLRPPRLKQDATSSYVKGTQSDNSRVWYAEVYANSAGDRYEDDLNKYFYKASSVKKAIYPNNVGVYISNLAYENNGNKQVYVTIKGTNDGTASKYNVYGKWSPDSI